MLHTSFLSHMSYYTRWRSVTSQCDNRIPIGSHRQYDSTYPTYVFINDSHCFQSIIPAMWWYWRSTHLCSWILEMMTLFPFKKLCHRTSMALVLTHCWSWTVRPHSHHISCVRRWPLGYHEKSVPTGPWQIPRWSHREQWSRCSLNWTTFAPFPERVHFLHQTFFTVSQPDIGNGEIKHNVNRVLLALFGCWHTTTKYKVIFCYYGIRIIF